MGVYRYSGNEIDAKLAQAEAEILHNAIKKKEYNHDEIVRILSTRSKAQLIATFNRYKDEHGTAITKVQHMLQPFCVPWLRHLNPILFNSSSPAAFEGRYWKPVLDSAAHDDPSHD